MNTLPPAAPAPRVSIALCTYNGAAYLAEQLDSLQAQDFIDIELVAADDASTDGSWALLQAYAPRFSRCTLIRNEHNLGVRANFEQVLRACRGDWIAPCDQDDRWAPTKLSRLLAAVRPGDGLVYSDSALIDGQGRLLGQRVSQRYRMIEGNEPRMFALSNCVSGHAMLFDRRLLARALPIPEGAAHDWWLAFAAASTSRLRYVDEPLVEFRQHADNASGFAGQRSAAVRQAQDRRARFDTETRNLASLAAFESPAQAFFVELLALWRARGRQGWTPALAAFLYRHRETVFAMKPTAPGRKGRHALKYLKGLPPAAA